jgi:N-acetyl-anhydromuramyl-L-alanine amidase AmpD
MNAANQVSYHFIISPEGDITQHVCLTHWAFANGTSTSPSDGSLYVGTSTHPVVLERRINANWYTVAIGFGDMLDGNPSYEQMDAAAWLVQHIRWEILQIYGIVMDIDLDHVIGHVHITPRRKPNCPGVTFPYERIIRLFNLRG